MSREFGTQVSCNGWRHGGIMGGRPCSTSTVVPPEKDVEERLADLGWSRDRFDRDYCYVCTRERAARKTARDLVGPDVPLFEVFDAAEEAGFARMYEDPEEGTAHFFCCGREVEYSALLGSPYGAKCGVCGTAIADVLGPAFSGSTVRTIDSSKVVTEDPCTWTVVEPGSAS